MSDAPCLSIVDVERAAAGEDLPEPAARHVSACAMCRARLERAREDARFVDRVRTLAAGVLGPEGAPRIPGYRAVAIVNTGAQGVVYRAVQESTSRVVAIKVLAAGADATPRQRMRAEREAEIAARLRHANIVTVFESRSLSDGRIAVVMEYVQGVPLDRWAPAADRSEDALRSRLGVFIEVCRGVHHAHLNGIIHRDLKPENIVVTDEGRPVVLDFGLAYAGGMHTTMVGEFAGTPAYASPEQLSGHAESVDALTDVYSLGVILYKLVCGDLPFDAAESVFEMARMVQESEPIRPRRRRVDIPEDLEAVILRALRRDKAQRYQSAAGLALDVQRFLAGEPVEAKSGSGWYLLRKAVAMNRRRLAWSGAAGLLLAAAALATAVGWVRAARASHLAAVRQEQAREEGVRARATTELLRAALPNAGPGHPEVASAVGEGLGRLFVRLETNAYADEPEVDQALRRLWSEVYTGFGSGKAASFVEYSEVSLRHGLVRLRDMHGPEHADIAAGMHALAGVLLVRNRLSEAESISRDALAMRSRLLGGDAAPTADTRLLLARILAASGRGDEAAAEAERADSSYRGAAGGGADLALAAVAALKAHIGLARGDGSAQEALIRDSLTRRLRRLPPDDPDVLASLADLADFVDAAPEAELTRVACEAWGESAVETAPAIRRDAAILAAADWSPPVTLLPASRSDALGRVLRLQETLLGPDDLALVGTLFAQLRACIHERRVAPRAAMAIRAAGILSARFGPDDFSTLLCAEEAASAMAYSGDEAGAAAMGARACAIWDAVPADARDPVLAGNARRRLAWYLAMGGRYDEAEAEYERARVMLIDAVGPEHHTVATSLAGLALCRLGLGDADGAERYSAAALAMAGRLAAIPADQLSHVMFVRGHVLRLRGDATAARPLLEGAWQQFYQVSGPRFPWRRLLLDDLAAICEHSGDGPAADRWRRQLREDAAAPDG